MQSSVTSTHGRAHAVLVVAVCAAALASAFACSSQPDDVHESDEAKSSTCISCHSGAYRAAANPVHANKMPETCQDCHTTKEWSPVDLKDHYWWPLQNKHVGVQCASCHSTGYRAGDTSKECQSCHRKDYDGAKVPKHVGFPLDCTMCHTDAGFKPASFKHPWALEGAHVIVQCNACHSGEPPKYKGTATDCIACHQAGYDASPFPNHKTFPHTCLDCHVMSKWTPAITGLHPEARFPLATSKHSDPRIKCQDCHVLARGSSLLGQNTECIACHLGSHVRPDIDVKHAEKNVGGYPLAPVSTNFCLACHPTGKL